MTQNLVAHGPNCSYLGTLFQSKIAILGYQLGIDSVSVIPGANLPNQSKSSQIRNFEATHTKCVGIGIGASSIGEGFAHPSTRLRRSKTDSRLLFWESTRLRN